MVIVPCFYAAAALRPRLNWRCICLIYVVIDCAFSCWEVPISVACHVAMLSFWMHISIPTPVTMTQGNMEHTTWDGQHPRRVQLQLHSTRSQIPRSCRSRADRCRADRCPADHTANHDTRASNLSECPNFSSCILLWSHLHDEDTNSSTANRIVHRARSSRRSPHSWPGSRFPHLTGPCDRQAMVQLRLPDPLI